MKIAFFVQYCHEAGTYFRWHNLAKAFVLNGHEVHVYAGDFNYKAKRRTEWRDGVQYRIIPSLITSRIFGNPSDPISALYRLFQRVDKDYDAYHLFQPFLQAFIPWYYLKLNRKGKFFYDWDDLWTGGLFQNPKSLREKYVFKLVSYLETKIPLQAFSTTTCSHYLKSLLPDNIQTNILYNGYWPITEENKTNVPSVFNKDPNLFYLGYIGKTAAELDWIIEAAKLIISKFPNVKFIIVGPAKSQIDQSGLASVPNMQYLGEVDPSEARFISSKIDVGLLPLENTVFNQSRFPIKFFDYLTAGTPVYYSCIGELKSVGEHLPFVYEGGITQTEWIDGLVDLIKSKIDKEKDVIDMRLLEEKYSWQSLSNNLEKIYIN